MQLSLPQDATLKLSPSHLRFEFSITNFHWPDVKQHFSNVIFSNMLKGSNLFYMYVGSTEISMSLSSEVCLHVCNGWIDIFGFLSCKNTVSTCDQIMRIIVSVKNSMQFHKRHFHEYSKTTGKSNATVRAKHVRCSYTMFMFATACVYYVYAMLSLVVSHGHYCVKRKRDVIYILSEHNW